MNTKILVQKKVSSLLCCLILFLSIGTGLNAQIVYTDIPDATPNASYSLDLNNDFIVDFIIQFDRIDKVMCIPQNSNAYAGEFSGAEHLPWALSQSTSICNSLTWYDSSNPGTMAWGSGIGYWPGVTNKYLALKLIVGSNTYYGWARFDFLSTSSTFVIKDYAYESTPNACILSGKNGVGINENTDKNFLSIFPNPLISSTTIQTMGNLTNATLSIYNAFGQKVKQVNNISGQTISLSRSALPGGLYFIRLTEGGKIIAVKKLIIAD